MRLIRTTPAVVAVILLAVAPYLLAVYPLKVLTEILVYAIFALSLDLLFGYTGLASLGHALYFGVGAYGAGLLAIHVTSNALVALVVGAAVGAVFALGTGWLAIRSRSVYFIMLTLAFSELMFSVATSWRSVTGGDQGLIGIPPATLGSTPMTGVINSVDFYWFALAIFVVAYAALWVLTRSSFGLSLIGIRENEGRMRSLGYPTFWYKFAAYIIAGGFAGLSGALYMQYSSFASPDYVGFELSALVLVMVMVGGSGKLYGAVLGAALVVVLRTQLSAHFLQWEMVLGGVFILFVYLLRSGLAGLVSGLGRMLMSVISRGGPRQPAAAPAGQPTAATPTEPEKAQVQS